MESCGDYESMEVPGSYTGPHLSFPILPEHATALVEAFRLKQVSSAGTWVTTSSMSCYQESRPKAEGMTLDLGCLYQGPIREI